MSHRLLAAAGFIVFTLSACQSGGAPGSVQPASGGAGSSLREARSMRTQRAARPAIKPQPVTPATNSTRSVSTRGARIQKPTPENPGEPDRSSPATLQKGGGTTSFEKIDRTIQVTPPKEGARSVVYDPITGTWTYK